MQIISVTESLNLKCVKSVRMKSEHKWERKIKFAERIIKIYGSRKILAKEIFWHLLLWMKNKGKGIFLKRKFYVFIECTNPSKIFPLFPNFSFPAQWLEEYGNLKSIFISFLIFLLHAYHSHLCSAIVVFLTSFLRRKSECDEKYANLSYGGVCSTWSRFVCSSWVKWSKLTLLIWKLKLLWNVNIVQKVNNFVIRG